VTVKKELHRLIDDLSEDEARQALDELRDLSAGGESASSRYPTAEDGFEGVTIEEGKALFDRAARAIVGLSGEEFLCEWDTGTLDREDPRVVHVAMLIPFVRST
jgi:hypothetical protein